MSTSRENISTKFHNGDIPNQDDFSEIFNGFVNKEDDKASFEMIEAGDDQHYVTPALLKSGLQNLGIITGNCYMPYKQHFDDFIGQSIELQYLPIKHSVKVFKNGQLLLEGTATNTGTDADPDYTLDYDSGEILFYYPVENRNIEVDYWYKNLGPVPEGTTDLTASATDLNAVHLTGDETITGNKTFNKTGTVGQAILTLNNSSTGEGFRINNSNNGKGIVSNNTGAAAGIYSNTAGTGDSIVSSIKPSGTGYAFVGQNDNTNTFTVDKLGNVIGKAFSIPQGTDQQILLADGSVKPVSDFTLAGGIIDWGIINNPTSVAGYGITDTYTKTEVNNFFGGASAMPGYNKSNWDTTFSWGNHAGLYRPLSYVPTWSEITGKPAFATVATSGSYNDLLNKPTIPLAQVNADWNASSGVAQILNKPNLSSYAVDSNTLHKTGNETKNGQLTLDSGSSNDSALTLTRVKDSLDSSVTVAITTLTQSITPTDGGDGYVYLTDSSSSNIAKINKSDGSVTYYTTNLPSTNNRCIFKASNGYFYVGTNQGTTYKLSLPAGTATQIAGFHSMTQGVEMGGYLYAAYGVGVYKTNLANDSFTILVNDVSTNGICIGPDSYLYLTDGSTNSVYRVDPSTGTKTVFITGVIGYGIGYNSITKSFFVGNNTSIKEYDIYGNLLSTISVSSGFTLMVSPEGTIYTTSGGTLQKVVFGIKKVLTTDMNGKVIAVQLSDKYLTGVSSPNWNSIINKPTTISGYGITDAYTQAQINSSLSSKADLNSPVFTGNPSAPTSYVGDYSSNIATTAFVNQQIDYTLSNSVQGYYQNMYIFNTNNVWYLNNTECNVSYFNGIVTVNGNISGGIYNSYNPVEIYFDIPQGSMSHPMANLVGTVMVGDGYDPDLYAPVIGYPYDYSSMVLKFYPKYSGDFTLSFTYSYTLN